MNASAAPKRKTSVVVMGVAGSGKSTVGQILARRLGWSFAEGDDFHSAANVAKMASGTPLTDEDRGPWLESIRGWIDANSGEETRILYRIARKLARVPLCFESIITDGVPRGDHDQEPCFR